MEGYSVTEAASVLGVPTERVWELLARGVLSGVPDGETGMRVFLQPRPAPTAVEEPRRPNGGGATHEREAEASPFRELLSEFRNLTERYGQALLALGEARGEVASLRSRVDLLEARFDLRLPMSGPMNATAQPAGWGPGQPAAQPASDAPAPSADAGDPLPDARGEPSPRRRRRRGQHRATDDFAEALARAEDPNPAELPGATEAGAAFAALRDEAALPRELPAAEPIAIIEPEPEPAAIPALAVEAAPAPAPPVVAEPVAEPVLTSPVEAEPDEAAPVIEPALVVVEPREAEPAPDNEATPEPEPEPEAEATSSDPEPVAAQLIEPEPATTAESALEPADFETAVFETDSTFEPEPAVASPVDDDVELPLEARALPEDTVLPEPEPEREVEAESQLEAEVEGEAEPEAEPELEVRAAPALEPGPEGVSSADASWDRDRYTARIVEPDWIPEERPTPLEPAAAVAPEPAPEPAPGGDGQAAAGDADRWDAEAEEPRRVEAVEAPSATPTGEETMLWFGRDPNRAAPAWPAEDDYAAEMEVASTGGQVARSPWVPDEPTSFQPEDAPAAAAPTEPIRGFATPSAPSAASARSQPPTSPASRAYRRLRRIFPG